MVSGHFADEGTQAGTVAALMLLWHFGFDELVAARTAPFVQSEMDNIHFDFGKLDVLMDMINIRVRKIGVAAAGALLRHDGHRFGGFQQFLAMPFMALLGTGFTFFLLSG